MNNTRRNILANICNELNIILEKLEGVHGEEEEVFENMPENLQYSERGMNSEEAIELMDNAIDSLKEAIDCLNDIN